MKLLDDWVNGKPDAWDYEAVLWHNSAKVTWDAEAGWYLDWACGIIGIGHVKETYARKAGALFIELWSRNISASFASKLMEGYLLYLSYQEKTR